MPKNSGTGGALDRDHGLRRRHVDVGAYRRGRRDRQPEPPRHANVAARRDDQEWNERPWTHEHDPPEPHVTGVSCRVREAAAAGADAAGGRPSDAAGPAAARRPGTARRRRRRRSGAGPARRDDAPPGRHRAWPAELSLLREPGAVLRAVAVCGRCPERQRPARVPGDRRSGCDGGRARARRPRELGLPASLACTTTGTAACDLGSSDLGRRASRSPARRCCRSGFDGNSGSTAGGITLGAGTALLALGSGDRRPYYRPGSANHFPLH